MGDGGDGLPGSSAAAMARAKREQAARLLRDAGQLELGAQGERETAAVLASLRDRFCVLHDLDLPGSSSANVDHLIIGWTGVFVIDSKKWGRVTAGDGTWRSGPARLDRECRKVAWQAEQLNGFLGVQVTPIMCFVGTTLPEPQREIAGVMVCSTANLLSIIRGHPSRAPAHDAEAVELRARSLVRRLRQAAADPTLAPAGGRHPRRPVPPARSPRPRRRSPRPSAVGVLARLAAVMLAGLIALGALPTVARIVSDDLADAAVGAMPGTTVPQPHVVPPAPAGAAPTRADPQVSTTALDVTTTISGAALPPTVEFSCAGPGQGWTAIAAPTEDTVDDIGFDLWYSVESSGTWTYWGRFTSGVDGTIPLNGLRAGATFSFRAAQDAFLHPPETDATTFTVPTDAC